MGKEEPVGPSSQSGREELLYLFFNIDANVQRVKRDIFTAVIYYYITTELDYAKRGLRPSAYDGVVLPRGSKIIVVAIFVNYI